MNNKEYRHRFLCTSPGGINCPCCGPAPGKERKRALRTARRRMKQVVRDEMYEELDYYFEDRDCA